MVEFLESGCALIVASVDAAGEPHAVRGWGLTVVRDDVDAAEVRLLIGAEEAVCRTNLEGTGAIAVTGTDVRTLRSTQVKGTALAIAPASDADLERARRFADLFFTDVAETDGTPPELLERLFPAGYFAVRVQVTELYDQTPGPAAGAPMTSPA
jgi:hypothetical protein